MRRFLAILLFAAFLLPFAAPALGQTAEDGVPACCRRNGAHHCGMSMAQRQELAATNGKGTHWQAPLERCPYCPATLTVSHASPLLAPLAEISFAEFFSHPAGIAQTESRWRMARDRSRQKRGPPPVSLA